MDVRRKGGLAEHELDEVSFTVSGAVKAIGGVGRTMSESDVTVDKVHTIVAGATHGVRAEGAAFGIGATKSSEDDVKIRAVTGVAL